MPGKHDLLLGEWTSASLHSSPPLLKHCLADGVGSCGAGGRRSRLWGVYRAGGGDPAEARAAAEEGAERRGDGAVRAGASGRRRHRPRRVQDPGGPAEPERGPARRLPDAEVHVCRAEAGERAPGPRGPVSARIRRSRSPREKQTGGTQRPRGLQPEAAPPAQCHQAAQGGRDRKEPHSEQLLGQEQGVVTPACVAPPPSQLRLSAVFLGLKIAQKCTIKGLNLRVLCAGPS